MRGFESSICRRQGTSVSFVLDPSDVESGSRKPPWQKPPFHTSGEKSEQACRFEYPALNSKLLFDMCVWYMQAPEKIAMLRTRQQGNSPHVVQVGEDQHIRQTT